MKPTESAGTLTPEQEQAVEMLLRPTDKCYECGVGKPNDCIQYCTHCLCTLDVDTITQHDIVRLEEAEGIITIVFHEDGRKERFA